jgi:hypothetical protein
MPIPISFIEESQDESESDDEQGEADFEAGAGGSILD